MATNDWFSSWYNSTSATFTTNSTYSWKVSDPYIYAFSKKCFRCSHEFTSHRAGRTTCYFKGCKCDKFTETEDMPEGLI